MDATSIIKKLLSDNKISIDEFIVLYDAIKTYVYTPYYICPYTSSPIGVTYDQQKQPDYTITCENSK